MKRRRRPEEGWATIKGLRVPGGDRSEAGYDKRATTLSVIASAEDKEADTGGLLSTQLFAPSEEQLEKINQFTLRRVNGDDVACFTTHSCNDIVDRDDDLFKTKTVKGFATLPQPYSPIGKAFMVGHDTSKLAVGRIFDAGTGTFDYNGNKHTKMTNDVYIPRKVAGNADFIENMEMGVNWAVSVGVMLGGATCSVGKEHDWGWGSWWCSAGHEKGLFYDPDSDEEDSWGWPMPVSEGTKGAVKTIRGFEEPKDMYELSMVYLGAQYFASLSEKDPTFSGIIKAASTKHIPIIGLRRDEEEKLPLRHLPAKAVAAAKNHKIQEEDGSFSWVDEELAVWSFTPGEDAEPMFLGRRKAPDDLSAAEINRRVQDIKAKRTESKEKFETAKDPEAVGALASKLDALLTQIDDALDQGDVDTANPLIDQAQNVMQEIFDALYEDDGTGDDDSNQNPEDPDWLLDDNKAPNDPTKKSHSHYHEHSNGTSHSHSHGHSGGSYDHGAEDLEVAHTHGHDDKSAQGDTVSKKAVMAALERHPSLPESFKTAIGALADDSKGAVDSLLKTVEAEFEKLKKRADNGDAYVSSLRKSVIDWYRKAKTDPRSSAGVDVSKVERLLERVGDDPETMEALIEDYQAEAQAKFPQGVRRSSVETDPNNNTGDETEKNRGDIESRIDGKSVTRLHG